MHAISTKKYFLCINRQILFSIMQDKTYFSTGCPASFHPLNPVESSYIRKPFPLRIRAAFLLRLPLRQYRATGRFLSKADSDMEAKCSSSSTLMLRLPGICPSEYSATVRTSRRCTSGSFITSANSSTLAGEEGDY